MRRIRKLHVAMLVLAAAAGVAVVAGPPYVRAAALVVRTAGVGGWPGRLAGLVDGRTFDVSDLAIPTRDGPLPAREYRPRGGGRRTVLVVPGINPTGLADPRLDAFARELAGGGLTAVTAALPGLMRFVISPDDTDRLEDAARWLADRAGPGPRPGVVGVSFAGGLAVVAAGRPDLHGRLAFVVSFGGYGDLPRVLRFLCTGELPDGRRERPHDYGTAVVLLGVLDRLVPADQVEPLRRAILAFMNASELDMVDKAAARPEFARARQLGAALPEPAAWWMRAVNDRDVETAGPKLLPYALERGSDPALSPDRSPAPDCPVYLLHGADDTVIPPIETTLLAGYLRPHTEVHALVTPLITHVEVERRIDWWEAWKVIRFWEPLVK
jgi:dienelactone hydrolase